MNRCPEAHFEELLAMLARHRDIAEELTFFTHRIHPVEPLEALAPGLEIASSYMARAREEEFTKPISGQRGNGAPGGWADLYQPFRPGNPGT